MVELKEETDNSIIIVGDFDPLFSIDGMRQKINKEMEGLNNTIHPVHLPNIYETFYPTTAKHSFSSKAQRNILQDRSYISLNTLKNDSDHTKYIF